MKEMPKDEWDDEPQGAWWIILFFVLPWVLGLGVVGIFLMNLFDIRL